MNVDNKDNIFMTSEIALGHETVRIIWHNYVKYIVAWTFANVKFIAIFLGKILNPFKKTCVLSMATNTRQSPCAI